MTIDGEQKVSGWGFEITLGAALQILQIVAVIGAVGVWAVTSANNGSETARNLATFRDDLKLQLRDLKETVDKRFGETTAQISALPTVSVTLAQQERRLTAAEERNSVQDKRLGDVERQVDALRFEVEGAKVTPAPHAR